MTLSNELRTFLISRGASLIGFANLSELDPDIRDGFPYGISIAIALNPHIIAEVKEGPTKSYVEECFRADEILDSLGKSTVGLLTSNGYKAKQQEITNTTGTEYPPNLITKLPHKTIATRAGLGWIGKNAVLITREYGSMVRLGSILTDAELACGVPVEASNCGDCTECIDVCPAKAITGNNWYAGIERKELVDVYACRKIARELLKKRTGGEIIGRTFCGICIAACPLTRNYLDRTR